MLQSTWLHERSNIAQWPMSPKRLKWAGMNQRQSQCCDKNDAMEMTMMAAMAMTRQRQQWRWRRAKMAAMVKKWQHQQNDDSNNAMMETEMMMRTTTNNNNDDKQWWQHEKCDTFFCFSYLKHGRFAPFMRKKALKNISSNQLVNEARLTWWVPSKALARNHRCSHHHYHFDAADKEPGSQAAIKSGGKEPHHSGGVSAAVTAQQAVTATALPTCLRFWEGNNNQPGRGCGCSCRSCPAHQAATATCSSKLVGVF